MSVARERGTRSVAPAHGRRSGWELTLARYSVARHVALPRSAAWQGGVSIGPPCHDLGTETGGGEAMPWEWFWPLFVVYVVVLWLLTRLATWRDHPEEKPDDKSRRAWLDEHNDL